MQINNKFILKKVGKETMLIPLHEEGLDMSKVFNLNEVGCLIYELIDAKKEINEIVLEIVNEYGVDEQTAKEDAIEFINELKSRGIIYD